MCFAYHWSDSSPLYPSLCITTVYAHVIPFSLPINSVLPRLYLPFTLLYWCSFPAFLHCLFFPLPASSIFSYAVPPSLVSCPQRQFIPLQNFSLLSFVAISSTIALSFHFQPISSLLLSLYICPILMSPCPRSSDRQGTGGCGWSSILHKWARAGQTLMNRAPQPYPHPDVTSVSA